MGLPMGLTPLALGRREQDLRVRWWLKTGPCCSTESVLMTSLTVVDANSGAQTGEQRQATTFVDRNGIRRWSAGDSRHLRGRVFALEPTAAGLLIRWRMAGGFGLCPRGTRCIPTWASLVSGCSPLVVGVAGAGERGRAAGAGLVAFEAESRPE